MPVKRPDVYEMAHRRSDGGTRRARGRSRYLRRTILRIFGMSPEERAHYTPRNGFEEAALNLLRAALSAQYAVAAWKEMRETLGEKVGTNWKATMDELEEKPTIISDIPTPHRKQ